MKKKLILFIATALTLSACDDLFEPAIENHQNPEQMYEDQEYMRGILHTVYSQVPNCYDNSEYATDDAVTNQPTNQFLQMATGAWTNTLYNPLSQWTNAYNAIQYIHLYLLHAPNVTWSTNEEQNALFARRLEGEAYGLRGMFYYYLMRAHACFGTSGELLGVPLFLTYQVSDADFNQPRASFQACVEQINSDLQRAEELLPLEYEDVSAIPAQFQDIATDVSNYNNVMGSKARGLFNGLVARAFRARMLILAASPLYQDAANNTTWEDAANAAAEVIDYKGGISGLASDGIEYYSPTITNAIGNGVNPAEILWRTNKDGGSNTQETENFPPSLYGTGYMNPSQNLVDAFPMANGYPVDDARSGYDANNPYANRDPRLDKYIIYNGSSISEKSVTINITDGNTDGINVTENRSTRTGYYMKKRMRWDVNLDPAASTNQPHYTPRIRYTEMYLDYAEAANEAWGPKGTGSHGYSAYDVIKAIRQRAGVGGTDDPYLEACAGSQEQMRELIRNERRLELCFEGSRFWDVRRWKLDLNEPVYGLQQNGNTYQRFLVEERSYQDYMYFSPIPLRMLHVEGADSILQGTAGVENPVLTNSNHWTTQPKNYVIYAIKYVNEWHGEYLRRGIDQMTANGATTSNIRHKQYIEDDEVVYLTTNSLSRSTLALTTQDTNGKNVSYNIALAFGEDGNCTLSSITDGITVSGTGKFIKDGEKNSLGGKDRDALYLDYQVDFHNLGMQYATKDTLVLRTRGVQGGKAFNAEVR